MPSVFMNKSTKCMSCGINGKIPIYYRDESRSYKVAFYVCKHCMQFSGFINWQKGRSMPFFNDMKGMIIMRLDKNINEYDADVDTRKQKILEIKKDPSKRCMKCKKFDYSKLYFRKRDKNTYSFTGYVCKNCRVTYFVNTSFFKFKTRDPKGYHNQDGSLPKFHDIPFEEYIGQFATVTGEDEEISKFKDITLRVNIDDVSKLEKVIRMSKIKIELIR